jgi:hypothetical protein
MIKQIHSIFLRGVIKPIFTLFLFLSHCTGGNYFSSYNPYINSNPTPEYSHPYSMAMKGGYIFHLNHLPGGIGENAATLQSGESCSHSFLYLVSIGDSSISTAMDNGNIQKIASVGYEQFAILSFAYHRFCTIVTGE